MSSLETCYQGRNVCQRRYYGTSCVCMVKMLFANFVTAMALQREPATTKGGWEVLPRELESATTEASRKLMGIPGPKYMNEFGPSASRTHLNMGGKRELHILKAAAVL